MAANEAQAVATGHPAETWAALLGSLTLLMATVGVLYKRLNDDIKDGAARHEADKAIIDKKFDNGIKAFSTIGEKLVGIGEKIVALEKEDIYQGEELDRLELDIKSLHSRLLIIETEHKHCQEIVKGLGK